MKINKNKLKQYLPIAFMLLCVIGFLIFLTFNKDFTIADFISMTKSNSFITAIAVVIALLSILGVGYEKVLLMQESTNLNVSQIISTFVYAKGIGAQQYDYATAVGLFNAVVNLIVLLLVNRLAKKRSEVSLF